MRALVASLLFSSVAQADPYAAPHPSRVVRLDVAKKRVAPPLRYSLGRRCPPEVPARMWLKQQLDRISTATIAGDLTLNMSDGRDVCADRQVGSTIGFFDPTTRVTFYLSIEGDVARAGVIVREGQPCGESWIMPVVDEGE